MAYYPSQEEIKALSFPTKILHVKVLLLNDNFQTIYEMKHEQISGNISTDVGSDIRNTLSITLGVLNKNVGVSENRLLWINQYIKILFGVQIPFKEDIIWYDKGIFVITDYSYNAQTKMLNINCSDLVCKLNGEVDGALSDLEVVIEADEETIRQTIIHVLEDFTTFTKYYIDDMPNLIPYELKFGASDSVWTILTKLRDLYPYYEMYFDTDGTFICKKIPMTDKDPIVLDDSILQKLYVSENDTGILKDIRNVSKVWGKCLDTDYYTETCEYSSSLNQYSAYFTGIAINDDGSLPTSTRFAVKIPATNDIAGTKIAIYNKANEESENKLVGVFNITNSSEQQIGEKFFIDEQSYVFRYRRNSMYVLGQQQIVAVNKLRNTEPTEEEIKADILKHDCDYISYTIAPNSPFAIEKIGERIRSFQGGEYDDIQAIDDCMDRAEYETYLAAKVAYSVTLEMVYIPWLQGNEKIRFRLAENGEMKDWIVQSISSNHPNGTMTITMSEFYPYYNFDINDPSST